MKDHLQKPSFPTIKTVVDEKTANMVIYFLNKKVENNISHILPLDFWSNYESCMAWRFCIQLFSQNNSLMKSNVVGRTISFRCANIFMFLRYGSNQLLKK